MIAVDVFCPLYKSEKYLETLFEGFKLQKNVLINKIVFSITDQADETLNIIKKYSDIFKIEYFNIRQNEFSHSLTREKGIERCSSKIVIMITQDIVINDENAFFNLANKINDKTPFCFGRQISKFKNIEKYIREKNYPKQSYIVSKKDIDELQIRAFFSSDAFSAYDRDTFIKLGGYDHKNLVLSEDMYYSRKCILNDYYVQYASDAVVFHSHKYKLRDLYHRYYLTGRFFKENPEFKQYKSIDSGLSLAKYVFKRALINFDLRTLIRFLPDMIARYLGKKRGEK